MGSPAVLRAAPLAGHRAAIANEPQKSRLPGAANLKVTVPGGLLARRAATSLMHKGSTFIDLDFIDNATSSIMPCGDHEAPG
ncbi:MAG TPA: hypothetical protein VFG05_06720 [Methylocella sp.]|nr:hypothetical protein [Methylocella sp.]